MDLLEHLLVPFVQCRSLVQDVFECSHCAVTSLHLWRVIDPSFVASLSKVLYDDARVYLQFGFLVVTKLLDSDWVECAVE